MSTHCLVIFSPCSHTILTPISLSLSLVYARHTNTVARHIILDSQPQRFKINNQKQNMSDNIAKSHKSKRAKKAAKETHSEEPEEEPQVEVAAVATKEEANTDMKDSYDAFATGSVAAAAAAASSPSESAAAVKKRKRETAVSSSSTASASTVLDEPASKAPTEQPKRPVDDGLIPLRNPVVAASTSLQIPPDTNFANPNQTMRYFSIQNRLNVHYTELNPKKHFACSLSEPGKGFSKSFFSINCVKIQRFDFEGGGMFKEIPHRKAKIIGPFGVCAFPRMWPYGDRFKPEKSKYAAPKDVGKIRFKLPLTNTDYYTSGTIEKPNVGFVDADADVFLSKWLRAGFDSFIKPEAYRYMKSVFPLRMSALEEAIDNQLLTLGTEYEEALQQWTADMEGVDEADLTDKPAKPDTSEKKRDEMLRSAFLSSGIKNSVQVNKKSKTEYVNMTRPVLRTLTIKERTEKKVFHAPDAWFKQMHDDPPPFVNSEEKSMPGYPKISNDLPMFRAFTAEEAAQLHANGGKNKVPYRLVPYENRFVVQGDVVAPIFGIENFDSKLGSGFRFTLEGIIWLGERGALGDGAAPVAGVDPTTYFLTAQKYTRTKDNFNPNTVENNDEAGAAGGDDGFNPDEADE